MDVINLTGSLKALLENGADPNAVDFDGRTVLHLIAWPVRRRNGPLGGNRLLNGTGVRLLLDHGVSVVQQDHAGNTPFHFAASGSDLHHMSLYWSGCTPEELAGALKTRNNQGETPLHWAAAGCKVDILEHLISRGADLEDLSANGWTPLMYAMAGPGTASEVLQATRLLLFHGADPLISTAEGWTALHGLARHLDSDTESPLGKLAGELILRGADVEARAPMIAGHENRWKLRRSEDVPETRQPEMIMPRRTPLHWAAAYGALGVAKALLAHGADPSAQDVHKQTAVEIASDSRLPESIVAEFIKLVEPADQ